MVVSVCVRTELFSNKPTHPPLFLSPSLFPAVDRPFLDEPPPFFDAQRLPMMGPTPRAFTSAHRLRLAIASIAAQKRKPINLENWFFGFVFSCLFNLCLSIVLRALCTQLRTTTPTFLTDGVRVGP